MVLFIAADARLHYCLELINLKTDRQMINDNNNPDWNLLTFSMTPHLCNKKNQVCNKLVVHGQTQTMQQQC